MNKLEYIKLVRTCIKINNDWFADNDFMEMFLELKSDILIYTKEIKYRRTYPHHNLDKARDYGRSAIELCKKLYIEYKFYDIKSDQLFDFWKDGINITGLFIK